MAKYTVTVDVDDDGQITASVDEVEEKSVWHTDPIPDARGLRFCWLRLRRHSFSNEYNRGWHKWKRCIDCGRHKRTAHLSCPPECWAGPA